MMVRREGLARVKVLAVSAIRAFVLTGLGNFLTAMSKDLCHTRSLPVFRANTINRSRLIVGDEEVAFGAYGNARGAPDSRGRAGRLIARDEWRPLRSWIVPPHLSHGDVTPHRDERHLWRHVAWQTLRWAVPRSVECNEGTTPVGPWKMVPAALLRGIEDRADGRFIGWEDDSRHHRRAAIVVRPLPHWIIFSILVTPWPAVVGYSSVGADCVKYFVGMLHRQVVGSRHTRP